MTATRGEALLAAVAVKVQYTRRVASAFAIFAKNVIVKKHFVRMVVVASAITMVALIQKVSVVLARQDTTFFIKGLACLKKMILMTKNGGKVVTESMKMVMNMVSAKEMVRG
ncbi:MAG: hypothetical protein NTW60_00955 [Candidatus Wolfebacteria bacterium]|nr:hypothetical protein [Candidatus Wolfebacteria bacterium]